MDDLENSIEAFVEGLFSRNTGPGPEEWDMEELRGKLTELDERIQRIQVRL